MNDGVLYMPGAEYLQVAVWKEWTERMRGEYSALKLMIDYSLSRVAAAAGSRRHKARKD